MNGGPQAGNALSGLRGLTAVLLHIVLALALFALVVIGLYTVPILMLVIFFAVYVAYAHVKQRGRG